MFVFIYKYFAKVHIFMPNPFTYLFVHFSRGAKFISVKNDSSLCEKMQKLGPIDQFGLQSFQQEVPQGTSLLVVAKCT